MLCELWRVVNQAGDGKPWSMFSIRPTGKTVSLIFSRDAFSDLFPNIDPDSIPIAPDVVTAEINIALSEIKVKGLT